MLAALSGCPCMPSLPSASPHLALNSTVTSSERPHLATRAKEAPMPTLLVKCPAFSHHLLTGGHAFKSVTVSLARIVILWLEILSITPRPALQRWTHRQASFSVCKMRIMTNVSLQATFWLRTQCLSAIRLPVSLSERGMTQSQIFILHLSFASDVGFSFAFSTFGKEANKHYTGWHCVNVHQIQSGQEGWEQTVPRNPHRLGPDSKSINLLQDNQVHCQ